MEKQGKIIKNVALLMFLTLFSKMIGFIRELAMGAVYGTSMHSDVYATAYEIPKVLFALLTASIATTFIPLYNKAEKKDGIEEADKFTSNIINIVFVIGVIISVIAFIFMDKIVKVFAIGFSGETLRETVLFTRLMLAGYVFSGLSTILSAYLQNKGNFFIPGIIGLPFNAVLISFIFISYYFKNVYLLPIGASLALITQYLIQLPWVYKNGNRHRLIFDIKDKYIKEMIVLTAPVIISVSVTQINKVVDRNLASTLVVGSISSLSYSNRVMGFFIGFLISTISAVIYPQLSKLSFESDKRGFLDLVRTSMNSVSVLILPITVVCILLARPIIQALFMRGAFNEKSLDLTSYAFIFYTVGMIGLAMRTVITKIYYSIGDTKTPMYNSIMTIVINIVLSLILIRPMQNGGLAFATSISYICSMFFLILNLKKQIGNYGMNGVIATMFKILAISLLVGFVSLGLYNLLIGHSLSRFTDNVILVISAGTAIPIYIILCKLAKVVEIEAFLEIVKRSINKLKVKIANNQK